MKECLNCKKECHPLEKFCSEQCLSDYNSNIEPCKSCGEKDCDCEEENEEIATNAVTYERARKVKLLEKVALIQSGFGGVDRNGKVVDRRVNTDAVQFAENSLMNTPKPLPVPVFDFDYNQKPLKNATPNRTTPKIGRNQICTCGSGKKYKKCCSLSS